MELLLPDVIVAEVTFVMEKVYRRNRMQIADALLDLIQNSGISLQGPTVLTDALLRYRAHTVDFPDALVAAMAATKGIPAISFERDLDKFSGIKRHEPKS